jgi:hypothetical protein
VPDGEPVLGIGDGTGEGPGIGDGLGVVGDVDGVVTGLEGEIDVPGAAVPGVTPVVPVVPGVVVPDGVVESGCEPAPFAGGVVAAPGPVPGAHGATMSAFGAPLVPSVPAVPVVPTAPGVTAPGADAVPFVAFGGTTPLVPEGPFSGTHGIVDGVVAGAGVIAGDGVEAVELCAITCGAKSPSAAAAA